MSALRRQSIFETQILSKTQKSNFQIKLNPINTINLLRFLIDDILETYKCFFE